MKKILIIITSALILSCIPTAAAAEDYNEESHMFGEPPIELYLESSDLDPHPEVNGAGYYIDDSYDLIYDLFDIVEYHDTRCWCGRKEKDGTVSLSFDGSDIDPVLGRFSCAKLTVRIPNTVNGFTVSGFYGSAECAAFDVDPENQYFKSDGQTVFSKDGKILLSYIQCNESTEYVVPDGTEIIGDDAFFKCGNLRKVYIPGSVKEIEDSAFWLTDMEMFVFEDFNISINQAAFPYYWILKEEAALPKAELVCTKTVKPTANGNTIGWNAVDGASYYEIYQKLQNDEYKLLGKTKKTSHTFGSLKQGSEYTLAVKPAAVIPAAHCDRQYAGKKYPETFTIEGTMSEDILIKI